MELEAQLLIDEYEAQVNLLIKDNILTKALLKQLQKQHEMLKAEKAEMEEKLKQPAVKK